MCSLRSVLRKGSCSSWPLLLMIAPAFGLLSGYFSAFRGPVPSRRRRSPRPEGLFPHVRIPPAPELDAQRRPDEAEGLAKGALEVTPIARRHRAERRTVHHDDRRVAPTLVGVAKLRANEPRPRRRLACNRVDQRPREARRGQLRHRGPVRLVDRRHERAQTLAAQRRHEANAREAEERELPLERALGALARAFVATIPLVDRDDEGPPALEHVTGDMRVLIRDAFGGVDDEDRDVG